MRCVASEIGTQSVLTGVQEVAIPSALATELPDSQSVPIAVTKLF
jgi:hypothetical protein